YWVAGERASSSNSVAEPGSVACSANEPPAVRRCRRYSSTVPLGALHDTSISSDETGAAVRDPGVPGGLGSVVLVTMLVKGEHPPGLHARTRYVYVVAAASPLSTNVVVVTVSITANWPGMPVRRSITYPPTVPDDASHARSIRVCDTTVAVSVPGRPGGGGYVVAEAGLLKAEQPPVLQAWTRYV